MEKGYLALVLHAHLPYVRHPEFDEFLEEDWLFEAITETYIPLLNMFEGLVRDGADFRLTMSVTPTLASMLTDELLQNRYINHIESLIELSYKEIERTRWEPAFNHLAHMYNRKFIEARVAFVERYHRNLCEGFKKFQDMGKLDIITCGATHGFLPLMEINRNAVRAQIKVAAAHYEKIFGRRPRGIWLPECGYQPGDDQSLREEGIRYFLTDTHGILHGSPRPKYGVFAPVYCKSGVAAFGRDMESSKAVWSAEEGYPGDYNYRDFYRDVGFDLDFEYIKPYIHSDGIRINTGIKYYRITGRSDHKEPYDPQRALDTAASHAGNFMFNREKQVEHLYDWLGKKPIIVSPYDAELYGHWWYEGPEFLNFLFRKLHYDQDAIRAVTLSEYLEENPKNQVSTPSLSSWGYKGYAEVWLEGSNDWIYRHLHTAADRMVELANLYPSANGVQKEALDQCARELLLAQSSDWAFIMKTGTVVPYAVKRFKDHIERFIRLYEGIRQDRIDVPYLKDIETRDNLFPEIDYRVYK
ncbi:MAG TPA: 1,4-alpha-glucan branching protein domain-containing protein [Candidatus Omnitrophota bacterium]|nr:1,4-alpha-glucan branching protein domain-containing protein [Candidatus Omnitrophota bacterium]